MNRRKSLSLSLSESDLNSFETIRTFLESFFSILFQPSEHLIGSNRQIHSQKCRRWNSSTLSSLVERFVRFWQSSFQCTRKNSFTVEEKRNIYSALSTILVSASWKRSICHFLKCLSFSSTLPSVTWSSNKFFCHDIFDFIYLRFVPRWSEKTASCSY